MLINIKMSLINLLNIFQKIYKSSLRAHCKWAWQSSQNVIVRCLRASQLIWYLIIATLFTLQANANQIIYDEEVETVIQQLTRPIVEAAGMHSGDVKFYIVLNKEVNAFVYGGRNIFINTGLLTLFNDPDVLKGVVAHELGHITGGHIARHEEKMQQLMPQFLLTNLLGVAAIIGGAGELGGAILHGGTHGMERSILRYSRENEGSADQAAFGFMHKSHTSSAGLLKLLQYFQNQKRGIDNINAYAQSHPVDAQRINAVKLSEAHFHDDFQSSPEERKQYALIVAKLRGFTEPLPELFKFNQKDLDPTARKYELAIALFRKPNLPAALANMNELIASQPQNPYFYELKGQMLFEHGHIAESIGSYKTACDLMPQANLIKLEYAIALIHGAGIGNKAQLHDSVAILKIISSRESDNPFIYRNLGLAYGKLGDLARSNMMLAEAAILQNNYSEAKKFIYNAKRYATKDKRMLLRIEDIERTIAATTKNEQ